MKECFEECKAACCKKWWITLLPSEFSGIAEFTGIPRKRLALEKCVLFAELFPLKEKREGVVLFNGLVPARIEEKAAQEFGHSPDFFLALPFLAFARKGESCVFLGENNKCLIHEAKPRQCRLFPAISLKERDSPSKLYPFCSLARPLKKGGLEKSHLKELRDYFSEVEGNGFSRAWMHLPNEGIVKIGSAVLRVPRSEFLALLGPYG